MKYYINFFANSAIATCAGVQVFFNGGWVKLLSDESREYFLQKLSAFNIHTTADSLNKLVTLLSDNAGHIGSMSQELARCNQLLNEWKLIAIALGVTGVIGLSIPHVITHLRSRARVADLDQYLGLSEFTSLQRDLAEKLNEIQTKHSQFIKLMEKGKAEESTSATLVEDYIKQMGLDYDSVSNTLARLEEFSQDLIARAATGDAHHMAVQLVNFNNIFADAKTQLDQLYFNFSANQFKGLTEVGNRLPELKELCTKIQDSVAAINETFGSLDRTGKILGQISRFAQDSTSSDTLNAEARLLSGGESPMLTPMSKFVLPTIPEGGQPQALPGPALSPGELENFTNFLDRQFKTNPAFQSKVVSAVNASSGERAGSRASPTSGTSMRSPEIREDLRGSLAPDAFAGGEGPPTGGMVTAVTDFFTP